MAGGEAKRMSGVCKQLLPVFGDTILGRIRKHVVREWGIEPIVLTTRPEIEAASARTAVSAPGETVDGLIGSSALWNEHTIILLGDVLYTPAAIRRIARSHSELLWYGNAAEIFAMSFLNKAWPQLLDACSITPFPGRLRTLYNVYHGLPPGHPGSSQTMAKHRWVWIRDATRDIDYPHQYERVVSGEDKW